MIIANAKTGPKTWGNLPKAAYSADREAETLVCRPQFPHPLSLPTPLFSYPVILSPTPVSSPSHVTSFWDPYMQNGMEGRTQICLLSIHLGNNMHHTCCVSNTLLEIKDTSFKNTVDQTTKSLHTCTAHTITLNTFSHAGLHSSLIG